ncbi:MAG: pantoate--beta-alanine ligase [Candidatus Stahlbacteria bacterium]|nr:pantoate--beta-alanine ligase [Candidatus Stahlbacteria bacterium]
MRIIKKISEMKALCNEIRLKRSGNPAQAGKSSTIGFVPTMGALHQGHIMLIETAKSHSNFIVVSIFVNPLQFGTGEDLKAYPRNMETDIQLLKSIGIDALFIPDNEEIYPEDYATYIELPSLSNILCGKVRPGHFRGVCTIVGKLFNIITPDIAVFGEKDAQQSIIIKKMVQDLNLGMKIITIPTVREHDGLAMSSRNVYLSIQEREEATIIYQALQMAKNLITNGEWDTREIKAQMHTLISSSPRAKIDYIEIVRKDTLVPIDTLDTLSVVADPSRHETGRERKSRLSRSGGGYCGGELLIAVAVWFGKTRLIDNITIKGSSRQIGTPLKTLLPQKDKDTIN